MNKIIRNLIFTNMINKLFYFFILVFFTASLSSCKKEDSSSNIYDKAYPVIITARSLGFETDQAPESYLKGESLGVSMLENGTDNVVTPYTNIRYISDGVGSYLNAANNDSTIYLPSTGESMDLATYFPKVNEITTDVAIDLTTNQEFGAKLQFGRINGLNKDNRKAELKMKNALSLITMDIDPSAFTGVTGINAFIKNTPVKGTMNIYNGEFTATEFAETLNMTNAITPSRAEKENAIKFYALVFPVSITSQGSGESTDSNIQVEDVTITIQITKTNDSGEVEDIVTSISLAGYVSAIESATNTNLSVTIKDNGELDVKVTSTNFTIDDWINNGGGIEVDGNESIQ